MPKLRPFIIQFRVGALARSDVHAEALAERLVSRMEEHLEEDDTVSWTQITEVGEPAKQEEVITRLALGRNELIRLHFKDTMALAQELDRVIWKLTQRVEDDETELPNDYDYNRVIEVEKALNRGENPLY